MSLIERLEAEEAGSRELDLAVYAEINKCGTEIAELHWRAYVPVTTSLDAALALAERVLPGYWPGIQKNRGVDLLEVWTAHLESDEVRYTEADGATPALALCIAILKVKETK